MQIFSHTFFGVAAPIFSIIAFIPYIRAIYKKETKPSGASWWTWTFINFVALASSRYAGAPWQVLLLPIWFCLSQIYIAILSTKYGDNNWDFGNKLCVAGACVGVALWIITGQPLLALIISIIADIFASIPNFRHVWTNPEQENRLGWTLGWGGIIFGVLAVSEWSLAEASLPIYFFLNSTVVVLLIWRPVFKKLVS